MPAEKKDKDTEERILVIKLSAFGDFVQALGAMAAIRRKHADAHITLLTTAPFVALARESGYFNDVWTDTRPRWTKVREIMALSARLRGGRFARVYDLQNSDRTGLYLLLTGLRKSRRPEWVGAARGASHRNAAPERIRGSAFDGHKMTLALAGIHDVTYDPLEWVRADAARFALPRPFIILVPGCSPQHPEKRWPVENFGALARGLHARGYTPVVIGTAPEIPLGDSIREICPQAINLCGQTSIMELVALARDASGAVGNDTGPMHLIAPTGCPSIVLFTRFSDPARALPLGNARAVLQDDGRLSAGALLKEIGDDTFRDKGGPQDTVKRR